MRRQENQEFLQTKFNGKYSASAKESKYIILDKRKILDGFRQLFKYQIKLLNDKRLSDIEKCVVLLQMFTFVGDDIYDEI